MAKPVQPIVEINIDDKEIGEHMNLFITCLTIFFARICDVSLGTIRIIFVGKGKSFMAFLIGFVEIAIWFLVAKDALSDTSDSPWIMISYSLGFAVGTYLGTFISEKYVKGTLGVQIVTSDRDDTVIKKVREEGYAVSVVDVKGKEEGKYMLFMEINKKHYDHVRDLIKKLDSKSFIVVNETKFVQNGYIK